MANRRDDLARRLHLGNNRCEIASNRDPTPNELVPLIELADQPSGWGRDWTRKSIRGISIFRNEIETLRKIGGGVNVGYDSTLGDEAIRSQLLQQAQQGYEEIGAPLQAARIAAIGSAVSAGANCTSPQ